MKYFSWQYTQFSQFNESDTLLMVSGVNFVTSGEIAVFSVQGEIFLYNKLKYKVNYSRFLSIPNKHSKNINLLFYLRSNLNNLFLIKS